jgi:UDPglucose 6-dehydrogenase
MSHMGHSCVCFDKDEERLRALKLGSLPFFEPKLEAMMRRQMAAGRLRFEHDPAALAPSDVVFICVDAPAKGKGVDGRNLLQAARAILSAADSRRPVLAVKSTVAPGTIRALEQTLRCEYGDEVRLVANPEFLREGNAIDDFLHPDRIVIGGSCHSAARVVARAYEGTSSAVLLTDTATAEMIKLTSNAFLATKISFINEISAICEAVGADVRDVAEGIGLDHRIGSAFLQAGLGFGGSCLPKDLRILLSAALYEGVDLRILPAVVAVNDAQIDRVEELVRRGLGSTAGTRVALLGLTFKAGTDDLRGSPALRLAERLASAGVVIQSYDPVAPQEGGGLAGSGWRDCYDAVRGCDATVICTEWPELIGLDFQRLARLMRGDLVVDARNTLDEAAVVAAGLRYARVGRRPDWARLSSCDEAGHRRER